MITIERWLQSAIYYKSEHYAMNHDNKTMNSLEQLNLLSKKGGMVTKFSRNITTASNGLPYYFVEFTSTNGSQYGIQAYGEEATELYSEARRILGYFEGNASMMPTPVISTR